MEDSSNTPPAEDSTPMPDAAAAPDEQPTPGSSTAEDAAPSTDDASGAGAGAPPAPPSPTPPRWRRVGAGIGALGAVLLVCGALLPTYGSGDYEDTLLRNAPLVLVGLLIAPALIILGISIWAWFNKLRLWLMVLGCLIIILALSVHWLASALFAGFACFDVCPPGGVHFGTGFWLPLVGFLLGGIGVVFAAIASARQRPGQATPLARPAPMP